MFLFPVLPLASRARTGLAASLILPAALAAICSASAATSTFNGGTDSLFATAANWSNGVPGTNAGTTSTDAAIFSATPAAPSTTTITVDNNRNVFGLTFDLAAPAYTIGTDASLLRLTTNGTTQVAATFAGTGVTETVNAPVSLLGNYTVANNAPAAQNTLLAFGGAVSGGNATNLALTVSGVGNVALNGVVGNGTSATFNVTKSSTGTLTLSAANTFNGIFNSAGAAGVTVATNTQAFGTNTAAVSGTSTAAGAINLSAASTLSLYNDGSGSNGVITYGGTVAGTTTAYALTALTGSTLNLGNSSNAGGAGTVTGNTVTLGSLQLNNTGTLAVNGLNGYGLAITGVTNFGNSSTQGAIVLSSNAPVALNGGIVDFSATTRNVALQGTGAITVNGGVSTSGGGVTTVSAGTGTTAATAGTVVFNGASSYTGGTTITNGILRTATATSAFGTGGITLAAPGVLDLRNDASTTFSNGTTGYAITESAAGATINVDRVGTTATGQTLTVGTLTTSTTNPSSINFTGGGNGYTLATGAVTVANITTTFNPTGASVSLGTVTATTAGNVVLGGTAGGNSVAGLATGTGTLTKSGAGVWSVTAASTFTGATSVSANGGTLAAAADGALAATSGITVNTGGILALASATASNNRVSDTAGISLLGGTIFKGAGVSEGTAAAVGLGTLTIQTGVLDYGNTAGTLTFTGFVRTSGLLTINNYLNNGGLTGGPDRLIFNANLTTIQLSQIAFTGYTGVNETALGNGFYEVYPAAVAVPEPGVWATLVLGGAVLGFIRRRSGFVGA